MSNTVIKADGVTINFPKTPYDCQVTYMTKVVETLNRGGNALLESPTGTGKTLCLLCSTLAWQAHARKLQKKSIHPDAAKSTRKNSFPIIYASRTHSQLTQVVSELRACGYRPRLAVLGSREQLCVNPRVSVLPSATARNHGCAALVAAHSCLFLNNLENSSLLNRDRDGDGERDGEKNRERGGKQRVLESDRALMDVGELRALGVRESVCSYFLSRNRSECADLLLLPYNYLLDAHSRASLTGGNGNGSGESLWSGAVVLLDEAHNVDQSCAEAASVSMSSSALAAAILEAQTVLGELDSLVSIDRGSAGLGGGGKEEGAEKALALRDTPSARVTATVLRVLFRWEETIDAVQLVRDNASLGGATGLELAGQWMVDTLMHCFRSEGVEYGQVGRILHEMKLCGEYMMDKSQDAGEGVLANTSGSAGPIGEPKIAILSRDLRKIFRGNSLEESLHIARDFKVFINEEKTAQKPTPSENFAQSLANMGAVGGVQKRVVNFWAFTSSVIMNELVALGVRSIILTSGTLTPLGALKEDLRIPFEIELCNPHVIDKNQIWVGTIGSGPTGKSLLSTYNERQNEDYRDELGNTILSVCQTMNGFGERGPGALGNTPLGQEVKGGILVFFPSYTSLEQAVARWKQVDIWRKLHSSAKAIVLEPRGPNQSSAKFDPNVKGKSKVKGKDMSTDKTKFSFSSTSSSSSSASAFEGEGEKSYVSELVSEFDSALEKFGSCLLLAVCRGKVSEGIDFSDSRGRVVIITGLPYAPFKDPWVILKRRFLDETKHASSQALLQQRSKSSMQSRVLLDGSAWYNQTASRAVNQAVGRVIRHRHDWGAIFFLDSRFSQPDQVSQLSGWIRPSLQRYPQLSEALTSFRDFSSAALANPLLNKKVSLNQVVDRRIVPNFQKEKSASELFPRQVSVSVDKLQGTEDSSFLNPELLTPSNDMRLKNLFSSNNNGKGNDTIVRNFANNSSTQKKNSDISDFLLSSSSIPSDQKIIKQSITEIPNNIHNTINRTNSVGLNRLNSLLSQQAEQKNQQMQMSSQSSYNPKLLAKGPTSTVNIRPEAIVRSTQSGQLSQSSQLSQDPPLSQATKKIDWLNVDMKRQKVLSSSDVIKQTLDKLQEKLDPSVFSQVKRASQSLRASDNQLQITDVNINIKSAVDSLVVPLEALLPDAALEKLLFPLGNSLQQTEAREFFQSQLRNKLKDIFKKSQNKATHAQPLSSQSIVMPASSTLSPSKRRKIDEQDETQMTQQSQVNSQSDENKGDAKQWKPSLRTMKVFQASSSSSSSSSSSLPFSSTSSVLSSLRSLRALPSASSSVKSTLPGGLLCAVCRETPQVPCAAQCGHVCCARCWDRLIPITHKCPVCRKPVEAEHIARIVLK